MRNVLEAMKAFNHCKSVGKISKTKALNPVNKVKVCEVTIKLLCSLNELTEICAGVMFVSLSATHTHTYTYTKCNHFHLKRFRCTSCSCQFVYKRREREREKKRTNFHINLINNSRLSRVFSHRIPSHYTTSQRIGVHCIALHYIVANQFKMKINCTKF